MSFVGTRPEVTKYVKKYTKEMRATLLLPAGITSEASIQYKDEAELLDKKVSVSRVNGIHTYPPNFIFITVTNPCSYGYYPKSCCISFDDQIIMNIKEVKNKL